MSMRMARLAARQNPPRSYAQAPEGQSIPVPAPTLGMNTRDGVSSLEPRECRSLRNMIPERGKLVIRKGKTAHQTITGATSIGSMFTHEGVSQDILLAAADGEIWDATGTPSALTSASYTLNVWSIAQFNDTTIGVNGTDTPWAFDGSSIGATGLSGSGLTIANLRTVHVVGTRMWFTEEGSADVWYLPVDSVTGTLTKFNLSLQTKGGYCVGIYGFATYTIFVMSSGEIVVYQGDPGLDFSFLKRYDAPRPVGYDPAIDVNGEPVIMTASGPLPFETIAKGLDDNSVDQGPWGKIAPSWAKDFETFGANAGWNAVYFMGLVILNLQTDADASKQWVYNMRTKAWSYFDNLDAYQFAELGGTLYFGDKGSNQIWSYSGGTDDGGAVVATIRGGFIYPFRAQVNGQYTLARLNVAATGAVTGQIQVDTDFREAGITAPEIPLASSGSGPWGEPWGEPWGTNGEPILKWSGVTGFGRAVAAVAQFNSLADDLEYFGTDLIGAPCGVIG